MDEALINPFIASVQNVFSTMLQLPVTIGLVREKSADDARQAVSGIVTMSGEVEGSVVLSMSIRTATAVAALFTGARMETNDPEFGDAIGELVNMICGNAKAVFRDAKRTAISCPSVIVGAGHRVAEMKNVAGVVIPCSTDCGEFAIEVNLREKSARPARALEMEGAAAQG